VTLTPVSRSEAFDTFERNLGARMERIFEQSMLGEVHWDPDRWTAFLDWIQGPLRRRMYEKWAEENPDKSIEHHPAYMAFEQFDRARLQGYLERGTLISVCFSAVKEMLNLQEAGLQYFGVSFRPPPSGFERAQEANGP